MDLRSKSKRQRLTEPKNASSSSSSEKIVVVEKESKASSRNAKNVVVKSKEVDKSQLSQQQPQDEDSASINTELSPSDAKDLTLTKVQELMETWGMSCRQPKHSKFFSQLSKIMTGYGNYVKNRGRRHIPKPKELTLQQKINQIFKKSSLKIVSIPSTELEMKLVKPQKSLKRLQNNLTTTTTTSKGIVQKRRELEKKWRKEQERLEAKRMVVEKVIANHLTAKIIFQHLSVRDLMNCSLVNTTWLTNARLVLRQDKKCFAIFRNSCRKLKSFKLLMESNTFPYNGITVDYSCYSCRSYRNAPPNSNSTLVLDPSKITIKYLKILSWRINPHCPIFYLIRSIFVHHSANLEELTTRLITSTNYAPIPGLNGMLSIPPNPLDLNPPPPIIVNSTLLPKLKQLVLPECQLNTLVSVINDIICSAPNLEKIINKVYLNIVPSLVLNKKAHIVKKFCFMPSTDELQLAHQFSKEPLQIEEMTVSSGSFNYAPFATVYGILRNLYRSSLNTLKFLDMTQVDLLMMTGPSIPTLPGVKQIHLHFNPRLDPVSLSRIDYNTKFPNLTSMIVDRLDPLSLIQAARSLPNEFRVWWQNSPKFTCSSVTRLKFELQPTLSNFREDDLVERRMIGSFHQIFSHVTHLHLHRPTDFPYIFNHLWTHWTNLETIVMTGIDDNDLWGNFDSNFTGISQENCNLLRETGNYKNYKRFQLEPSILNLTKLKLLRLHIHHQHIKCEDDEDTSRNIFLTQVTGKCGFEAMPGLKVEISRDSCQYRLRDKKCYLTLDCLKPYVRFLYYSYDFPKEWQLTNVDEETLTT